MNLPTLATERLILRGFQADDAPAVRLLASDREVASTTRSIPHPYEDGMAEAWIAGHGEVIRSGAGTPYAVALREGAALVGAIGLIINPIDRNAELGYWIGVRYWGCGYASEAADALLAFGFAQLALHRIHARHLTRNPASGRVMQKIGMRYEGCLRQHIYKWGVFEDLACYALLADEWHARQAQCQPVRASALAAA